MSARTRAIMAALAIVVALALLAECGLAAAGLVGPGVLMYVTLVSGTVSLASWSVYRRRRPGRRDGAR